MSDGDSYFYDKAEPKHKSDAEKRRNMREAEDMRAQERYSERKSREEKGLGNIEEDLRRLDPDNDD